MIEFLFRQEVCYGAVANRDVKSRARPAWL